MVAKKRQKVFVALSGGVDSSVAALLLKERAFYVTGVHIKMWSPRHGSGQADPLMDVCRQQYQDRIDAMRVAAHLGIPFETWDFTKEYKQGVVDYMIGEYAAGRTPNPDVMCNKKIKFGVFLKRALEAGADYIATGHYVRKVKNREIAIARDLNKDQSYFLWTLTREELQRCLFPIGDYTKPEVRLLARKYGLPTADKKDSQGLCFIGKIDVREFLKNHIPEKRGLVLTTSGKKVGEHSGLEFLTIGQRHGLGIGGRPREVGEPRPKGAGGTPYYVAEKDFATNTLVVADEKSDPCLNRNSLIAEELNWISGAAPELPGRSQARIRYRHELQPCRLEKVSENGVKVIFDAPERAIAPGQSIVFYKGERLLGGGVIRSSSVIQ